MKKNKDKKIRRHQALFDSNLPFCKPKVEEPKTAYTRKSKYKEVYE